MTPENCRLTICRQRVQIDKLKAELAEARELIAEESASHFSTDDDTPCFCGLCDYHHREAKP